MHPSPPLGSIGSSPWALCKLGSTIIPATLQLTAKDIAYRAQSADVKMLVCVNDDYVCAQAESALPDSRRLITRSSSPVSARDGFHDELVEGAPAEWERPVGGRGRDRARHHARVLHQRDDRHGQGGVPPTSPIRSAIS